MSEVAALPDVPGAVSLLDDKEEEGGEDDGGAVKSLLD